jgi:hypothetical protein
MKYINKLFDYVAIDGCKHIILSAVMTVVLNLFLPTWAAAFIALAVGGLKEYYDYKSGTGQVQVKDVVCDVIGVLIGVL